MGQEYQIALNEKISELGAKNLRVYINSDGVNPHYEKHLIETFTVAGVTFVSDRESANFIFEGHCQSTFEKNKITAFFSGGGLQFAGTI